MTGFRVTNIPGGGPLITAGQPHEFLGSSKGSSIQLLYTQLQDAFSETPASKTSLYAADS